MTPRSRAIRSCGSSASTVAHRGDVGMPEERVVVDGVLRVERAQRALGGDDQRVDLDEHRRRSRRTRWYAPGHDVGRLPRSPSAGMPAAKQSSRAWMRLEARQRVDVQAGELLGRFGGDLLDVDAALGGQHEQRLLGAAVERDREVVLARDVRRALDPQPAHDVAADVHAEDVAGVLLGLVGRRSASLMPPALPRPPTSTCALTMTGAADPLGGLRACLGRRCDLAVGHGDAEPREELLALVLVEIHGPRDSNRRNRTGAPVDSGCRRTPAMVSQTVPVFTNV